MFHFHVTQQCSSCITLGASELEKGTLVFGHINVELPENRALVERYQPTGSSIWIGVYSTGFYKEEQLRLWYKLGDKEAYSEYLTSVLGQHLKGDLS